MHSKRQTKISIADISRFQGRPFVKPSATHFKLYSYLHKLCTLPFPFPFITRHNFPDLLRLAAFIGLNVLWGWNDNQYTTDFKLYGWLTIANGGLGLLMAARTNLFAIVARIPSSTILMYHRWIGLATFVHATIHFALNTRHYIITEQLDISYMNQRIQVGIMAWISLVIIAITSVGFIRRRWFEAFYYSHALFFLFVVGALIHASNGPEFLLPGLLLWVVDRVIRFAKNFRSVSVKSVTQYPGDLTKFKVEGVQTTHPGQVAWIQIAGVSYLNWHPFTIASAPGEKEAVLAVRGLGSYTKKLQSVAANAKETSPDEAMMAQTSLVKMRLDGPYGVGHLQWGLYPVTVLVAGGIGITPGISIATYIIKRAMLPDLEANGPNQWHIHLLWIIKDSRHAQWFEEELTQLASLSSDPAVPATLDVTIHVTGGSTSRMESLGSEEAYVMDQAYKYGGPGVVHQGRPNLAEWFDNVKSTRRGLDAAVNACGPRPLVDAVRKAAAKASSEGSLFHVEEEKFEL